ncbi:hypothetical protein [Pseudooceanicola sp.]|uniref:hypothetical protein n=1 Tax=Pseudooceanicola sp. TaxID=1914328 RepID=UPI0035C662D6
MTRREDLERTKEWMEAHEHLRQERGPEPEVFHYAMIGAAIAFCPVVFFAALSGIKEPGLPGLIVTAAGAGAGYLQWREKAASRYRDTCRLCENLISERRRTETTPPK